MIIVKGETYFTIIDAAKTLGVSTKTIRGYIEKGIIPALSIIRYWNPRHHAFPYGIHEVHPTKAYVHSFQFKGAHEPDEPYMKKAKQLLDRYKTVNHG